MIELRAISFEFFKVENLFEMFLNALDAFTNSYCTTELLFKILSTCFPDISKC
jgi:hypothetical protein